MRWTGDEPSRIYEHSGCIHSHKPKPNSEQHKALPRYRRFVYAKRNHAHNSAQQPSDGDPVGLVCRMGVRGGTHSNTNAYK